MNHIRQTIITFNQVDLDQFAKLSRDYNPLHVDYLYARKTPYGKPVVFGALGILKSLEQLPFSDTLNISNIRVEFHNAIFLNTHYQLSIDEKSSQSTQLQLLDNGRILLRIDIKRDKTSRKIWKQPSEPIASHLSCRDKARILTADSLQDHQPIVGTYSIGSLDDDAVVPSWFNQQYEQAIVMLASYLIGMEIPGQQALFSKLDIQFAQPANAMELFNYRIACDQFDEQLNLLKLDLQVSDASNISIATGKLQSFVRNELPGASLDDIRHYLTAPTQSLDGKTALVIGGSRGLGATLVQALVLNGAYVYLNFAHCEKEATVLQAELRHLGDKVFLLQGSVEEQAFCQKLRDTILEQRGTLDILLCNACSAPQPMVLSSSMDHAFHDYIQNNLKLVSNPMYAFLDILNANNGTVVAISSSYVETGAKEFPHYVGLKNLLEGITKCASLTYKNVSFIIPRPPKLLTDMSNTPIGNIGTIAPEIVAAEVVSQLTTLQSAPSNFHIINSFTTKPALPKSAASHKQEIQQSSGSTTSSQNCTVNIAATFSIDLILPSLRWWEKQLGLNLDFTLAPYNQVFQQLLSQTSSFHQNQNGQNFVLFRFEDWLVYRAKDAEQKHNRQQNTDELKETLLAHSKKFMSAVQNYRSVTTKPLVLALCPSFEISQQHPELSGFLTNLEESFTAQISAIDDIGFLNVTESSKNYQFAEPRDSLRCEIGHIPYTDEYFHVLGTLVTRQIVASRTKPYKVIVLDCDNTLWSGVCEEAGATGVEINNHFRAFQKFLLQQQVAGVLLCLCSKNREQAVWDVFAQHPDMVLKKEHLVDSRINWDSKASNIESLAKALNLGLDSFIFIDDNPIECAEVRANCPQVLTLQTPTHSSDFDHFIHHLWILDKHRITDEDRKRTRLYQEDKQRQKIQEQSFSFADFIKELNLQIVFEAINEKALPRAAQLTKRTNQFNLNTKRRSESEISELLTNDYLGFTVTVNDRFGDYGYVGVVIAKPDGNALVIDTLLLSCRVLGRGVEHQIVAQLGKLAASLNLSQVVFPYVRSKKNEPVAQFLQTLATQLQLNQVKIEHSDNISLSLPSEKLQTIQFDCSKAPPTVDDSHRHQRNPENYSSLDVRNLEICFERIIFPYSNIQQLNQVLADEPAKIESNLQDCNNQTDAPNTDSCLQQIKSVFAAVLGIEPSSVDIDENLEALVDESYKIIELTVAIKEKYPFIPQTLLFETRNIRELTNYLHNNDNSEIEIVKATQSTLTKNHFQDTAPNIADNFTDEDIAIIGMNGIFPGANSIEEFWENLKQGICSIRTVPEHRWEIDRFFSPGENRPDKCYSNQGGFIDNIYAFDNDFFSISPREAETMDPQQRLFLQTVWGLFEDAGYTRETISRDTGVFVGVIASDYALDAYNAALNGWSHYRMSDYYQIANRISYFFDLHGPSLALDSACSSSAHALHLACHSIKNGECCSAIVGGVNLISHPSRLIQYSQMQMISKTGICSPFSERADGTLFGEGFGALMLKPLRTALQDGDNIHGIIKSTAVNSGGKTNGFTVPNPKAQAQLISQALIQRNIDPRSISYIEAHGTATNLGDPIEIRGLTEGFKNAQSQLGLVTNTSQLDDNKWCAIGSVKANIGHLESGAAMAGIIKCLLQMKHEILVPSLTQGTLSDQSASPVPLNPKISFADSPFKLQYAASAWKRPSNPVSQHKASFPLRAGISSFGAGGSNSHIIIEEPPQNACALSESHVSPDLKIIVLSGRSESQLLQSVSRLRSFLKSNPKINLTDMAYTLQIGREHLPCKFAIVCDTVATLTKKLEDWLKDTSDNESVWLYKTDSLTLNTSFDENTLPLSLMSEQDALPWIRQWLDGKQMPWQRLYETCKVRKISLPKTLFIGKSYGIPKEHRTTKEPDLAFSQLVDNPFLGIELATPLTNNIVYQSYFDLFNLPYLTDHRIYGTVVVPGSMYIAYALTTMQQHYKQHSYKFNNLTFIQALMPEEGAHQPVQFCCNPNESGKSLQASIISRPHGAKEWTTHFSCEFDADILSHNSSTQPASIDIEKLQRSFPPPIDVNTFYEESTEIGFNWGPRFQCITTLYRKNGEALGLVVLAEALQVNQSHYRIHPALLDACFQIFVPSMSAESAQKKSKQAYLPLGVHQVTFYDEVPSRVWSYVTTTDDLSQYSLTLNITLYSETGKVVADFQGMNVLRTSKQALMALTSQTLNKSWCYSLQWQPYITTATSQQNSYSHNLEEKNKLLVFLGYERTTNAAICRTLQNHQLEIICDLPETPSLAPTAAFSEPIASQQDVLTEDRLYQLFTAKLNRSHKGDIVIFYGLYPLLNHSQDSGEKILLASQKNWAELQILLRVIDRINFPHPPKLQLLTRSASSIDARNKGDSLDAALWSLGRVIALEYPRYWGSMIDVEMAATSTAWQQVVQAIEEPEEDHFLIRDKTYVARLENQDPQLETITPIRSEGSYFITGAFGSLGKQIIGHLVKRGAKSLILLGRNKPDYSTLKLINDLQEQNVQVLQYSLDIVDQGSVTKLFQELDEQQIQLKGIIHLAGVLDDGMFVNLDRQRFNRVLQPKVVGTWNLHQATQHRKLDFFILFSSASSILGAPGQANYALANGFMDAFAAFRRHQNLPATSINWGPWSGEGMAAEQSHSRKIWTNDSLGSIQPKEGLDMFAHFAEAGNSCLSQVAVLPYNWSDLLHHYPTSVIPSSLRSLASKFSTNDTPSQVQTPQCKTEPLPLPFLVAEISTVERKHQLAEFLRGQIRKILGFTESDEIDGNRSFLDMGFDSLMAVSFRTLLANTFQFFLPATLIFDYPTLNQLIDYLYRESSAAADSQNCELKDEGSDLGASSSAINDLNIVDPDVITQSIAKNFTAEQDFSLLSQNAAEALLQKELDELERMLANEH